MSKILAKLLDESELNLGALIGKLEALSGYNSEDVRLLDEVSQTVRAKIASLSLDPIDTKGPELYHALRLRFMADCQRFEKLVGDSKNYSVDKRLNKLAKLAAYTTAGQEVWALKPSVAKAMLKAKPPHSLMKRLHYRSVDSMLKHEDIASLFAGMATTSSERWQKNFWKSRKLSPLDFESQKLKINHPPSKRWQSVVQSVPVITSVPQLGAIVVWPTEQTRQLDLLALLALVSQAIENVHLLCTVAKAQQFYGNFSARVTDAWQGQSGQPASLAGIQLSWRSLLNHLGKQPGQYHPESLEPYIYPQDLHRQSVGQMLASVHPSLAWWGSNDHTLSVKGGVSLNIVDSALNYIAKAEFKQRRRSAAGQALWDELLHRYLSHASVFNRVTEQLEQSLMPTEAIRVVAQDPSDFRLSIQTATG